MDAVPFIFLRWGFWSLHHWKDSLFPAFVTTVCFAVAGAGAYTMQYDDRRGFALLAAAWFVYVITGAIYWTRIMKVAHGDPELYHLPRVKRP